MLSLNFFGQNIHLCIPISFKFIQHSNLYIYNHLISECPNIPFSPSKQVVWYGVHTLPRLRNFRGGIGARPAQNQDQVVGKWTCRSRSQKTRQRCPERVQPGLGHQQLRGVGRQDLQVERGETIGGSQLKG